MNAFSNGLQVDQSNAALTQLQLEPPAAAAPEVALPVARVVVICSSCKSTLSVKRIYLGSPIQCKQCGQLFRVPADVDGQAMPLLGRPLDEPGVGGPQPQIDGGRQEAGVRDKALLEQLSQLIAGSNLVRAAHDKLRAEYDELRADRDAIAGRLEKAELALRQLEDRNQELATALAKRESEHEATLSGLRADLANRESDHEAALSGLRAERQQLVDEMLALRENADEATRIAEQLISASLQAEEPAFDLAPPDHVETVRAQAAQLKLKLDEANELFRAISESLDGMGISV